MEQRVRRTYTHITKHTQHTHTENTDVFRVQRLTLRVDLRASLTFVPRKFYFVWFLSLIKILIKL